MEIVKFTGLFGLEKMERLEELVIEGFEPVSTKEFFPNLNYESLYSPIVMFERFGDLLVAKTGKHIKNQALVLISEDELTKAICARFAFGCYINYGKTNTKSGTQSP